MVSTPTTRNRLNKMGTGDATNTWGSKLNSEVFDLIDEALDGFVAVTVSGNVTLTSTNYVTDQARMRQLWLSGDGGYTITLPGVQKWYLVRNACSAAVTFTAGGVTASVPAAQSRLVFTNGTDCYVSDDGASLAYVNATFLPLAGGTLTGNLVLSGAPTSNLHAATKLYVDGFLPLAGGTMTGALTLNAAPTVDLHASTKKYVDDTAFAANAGILPGQGGNSGKYLTTNGTTASWGTVDLSPYLTTASAASTYLTTATAASTYQPLDSDLTAIAALTTAAYGRNRLTWLEATTSGDVNPCVVRTRYYVDTGTAARTLTLPAAPADGDEIFFADKDGNAGTNNFTIGRNGKTIAAAALDLVANVNNCAFMLRYRTSTTNWELVG